MYLSSSFYKPALLSVDCNRVSVGPLRGVGSQGMSGNGFLPLPPPSMDEEMEPCPPRVGGDVLEPYTARRRALEQFGPLLGTPHGPPVSTPMFL